MFTHLQFEAKGVRFGNAVLCCLYEIATSVANTNTPRFGFGHVCARCLSNFPHDFYFER